ncbi:enoyl-CoA delta isomerase 1, mitochondrial [Lingula anatina]|uniref:Enoyl-CoA delta isomerase 1, mitochondrial n=1 Tax=Lingula anatina TaxID=7574 RepID=A0A1S3JEC8_LINAN|nr:enoyl-CoA delta isomerase 1, mitochondrial [Lingula anatina]XP_013408517.1 enoyl-CoA delta isomerase 1, mitochondrial [Lingula anatina]XP_013408518.1 enoyl-CoA delta isomerase 1, mitochondrial [Lingula anatina]|eukprot:XP_013408516.1 enoyl-CoA delta isomerase 1, mitochondrial [Lingula anatina]
MSPIRALLYTYNLNRMWRCSKCFRTTGISNIKDGHGSRFFCSDKESTGSVHVNLNSNTGVATLTMNNHPVNALNTEFMQSVSEALKELQNDEVCRAVILTSGIPKIFSSGLDLNEMYQPDAEKLREFWITFQEMWMRLYAFPKTTMAAITGHSPAAGAVIAMSCDYRVMAENYNIGLTVTRLGIPAPSWIAKLYVQILGWRKAEQALLEGKLFTAEEALTVGLVDQVVPLKDVIPTVEKELEEWLKVSDTARSFTKEQMRRNHWMRLKQTQESDIQSNVALLSLKPVQKHIGEYISKLKSREK